MKIIEVATQDPVMVRKVLGSVAFRSSVIVVAVIGVDGRPEWVVQLVTDDGETISHSIFCGKTGWPIGASDCKPLATDKYQQWLRLHVACCREDPNV